ncbi:copper chaperone PCu(A)C [Pseudonocardia nigra]|uniref:copper chaperone PCu(A)C n=1 Tax=Pseudonocardia nigra TaxID=1921578 RepID=UPI001C60628E|nr:copper chaperone PCu(A)C [Pseudonocardia nigra]
MSRTERFRPTGAAAVIGAMIGAVALAGCSAGQVAQTSGQVDAVAGASAESGQILLRNTRIEFAGEVEGAAVHPRGGDAPLQMRIVNTGGTADRLVSVSSPVASSVEVTGVDEVQGGQALEVDGEPPAPPAAPAATGSAEPTPAAGEAARPTGTPATSAPAGEETDETHIVLTGLREDIQAGITYPVVFTFERAGEIRVEVPVGHTEAPREIEHASE